MDGLTALPLMPVAAMLDYASVVIFALTGALCFAGLRWLEGRAAQERLQRARA